MNKKLSARTTWIICAISILIPPVFILMLAIAIVTQIQENNEKKRND